MFRKAQLLYLQLHRRFKRKETSLSETAKKELSTCLQSLETAIRSSDKNAVKEQMAKAKELSHRYLRKSQFTQIFEFLVGLAVALVIAVIVRQMWFEPYEIPTGSMRPTFKEQDRLVVSKTALGLNIPLKAEHFYFSPHLVKRNGIVTLTSENMDIPDADTRYFYLFPGKKQFVKRLIAKPGDTLYFYGGKILGYDAQGQDISSEFDDNSLELIDHIPFLRFEGQLSYPLPPTGGVYSQVELHQMGQPIALLDLAKGGKLLSLGNIRDDQFAKPQEYGELWGIDNFSMTRLLSKEEAVTEGLLPTKEALLYLELAHHPRLNNLELARDINGKLRPSFRYEVSHLPLNEADLKTLFDHLYTARFRVKNGMAIRYSIDGGEMLPDQLVPRVSNIPDGLYEFYYGKAYKIGWQGIATELPKDHPLYEQTPERLLLWFNLGLDFNNLYKPTYRVALRPHRYAYFRDGDLYVMGQPLWKKEDPKLAEFVEKEKALGNAGKYVPFIDSGRPTKETIGRFGLKLPPQNYLVLGDNHAMSGDSRVFGFVPEGNLRGAPNFLFWPPGSRWGLPNQLSYPWFTLPNIVIWALFLIVLLLWRAVHNYRWKTKRF